MKSLLKQYSQYLTGKLEYFPPNRSEKLFEGYIKLTNDPKGQNICFENLILRGSVIKYSDWILGIMIDKGREITYFDLYSQN